LLGLGCGGEFFVGGGGCDVGQDWVSALGVGYRG
jgi:hypothetical protein